jgi:hypothetical protein
MKLEGIVLSKHIPLFVEYVNGSNLKFMCQNIFERQCHIDPSDIDKISIIFGEIAGLDFLIGNTDRFIPNDIANFNLTTSYNKTNGGNCMIEIDLDRSDQNQENDIVYIKTCHLIDNAPYFASFFSLAESKAMIPRDDEDNEDEYHGDEIKHSSSGEEMRQKMFNSFKFFFNATQEQLEFIASIITLGLKNELISVLTNRTMIDENKNDLIEQSKYKQYAEQIQQGIVQGLKLTKDKFRDPGVVITILDEIENERNYIKTTHIVLDFIRKNLEYVQSVAKQ